MIFLLKSMRMERVFVEENNLAMFGYQLLVNGCKYPDVPIFDGLVKNSNDLLYRKYSYLHTKKKW